MSNENENLLRYYNQVSLTHASIVVGSVFGLFSILRIISDSGRTLISKEILTSVYLLLLLFGAYEAARYSFFSDKAKKLAREQAKADEWWEKLEFIHPVVTILFRYGWAFYVVLGLIALWGGWV